MAESRIGLEKELYPLVEKWVKVRFSCFATGVNTGIRHGRIDVVGVRDTGGDLSGTSEVIAVEVKRGTQPFATSAGQAVGYSVYADRCYLAELRPGGKPFTSEQLDIAAQLGLGLLSISPAKQITEVLSAPAREPLPGLRLQVLEKLALSQCAICSTLFRRGESKNGWQNVSRQKGRDLGGLASALKKGKGYLYWLWEAGDRDVQDTRADYHRRRYICKDCVSALFSDFSQQ